MGDQSGSEGIEKPARRDPRSTARPSGCYKGLGRDEAQGQLEGLLATMCINTNDRFSIRFVLQAAEQGGRGLTAKRSVRGQ